MHRGIIGVEMNIEHHQTAVPPLQVIKPGACWPMTNPSQARSRQLAARQIYIVKTTESLEKFTASIWFLYWCFCCRVWKTLLSRGAGGGCARKQKATTTVAHCKNCAAAGIADSMGWWGAVVCVVFVFNKRLLNVSPRVCVAVERDFCRGRVRCRWALQGCNLAPAVVATKRLTFERTSSVHLGCIAS